MDRIPIDWDKVDWFTVGELSALVLLAGILGNILAFGSRLFGALFTAVLFAIFYVAWIYWLRGLAFSQLPIPT